MALRVKRRADAYDREAERLEELWEGYEPELYADFSQRWPDAARAIWDDNGNFPASRFGWLLGSLNDMGSAFVRRRLAEDEGRVNPRHQGARWEPDMDRLNELGKA